MAGKYQPLTAHFMSLTAAGRKSVECDFAEIARLVGGLPPTAYSTRQWWGNSSSVQAQSWRDADWHVAQVDFERRRVRYERGSVGTPHRERRTTPGAVAEALAVTSQEAELDVRVLMTWEQVGEVVLHAGDVAFPALPRSPGLYRISMTGAPGQRLTKVYIGESHDLRGRVYGYRRPGSRQLTNQRLNGELLAHLGDGGRVTVAVVTSATIQALGATSPLPLARRSARVLAEHAALALVYLDGTAVVINHDKGEG